MTTSIFVTLKATANARLLKAATSAVLLRISLAYDLIAATATVGAPWDGYAYDYFSEDYTLVTT